MAASSYAFGTFPVALTILVRWNSDRPQKLRFGTSRRQSRQLLEFTCSPRNEWAVLLLVVVK
eukprot:4396176-Amphidinium_carterae.1